jgi:hypothetical protein
MIMPSEQDLRDLFANAPVEPGSELNATRVIARTRARRLPKQIAAGAVGTLAVAGILFVGVQVGLPSVAPSTVDSASKPQQATDSAGNGAIAGGTDGSIKHAPARKINLCEGAVAQPTASSEGLELDVMFPPTASFATQSIQGTVRLTNTSTNHVSGYTAESPAITLSQNGVVLWHSNGPTTLVAVQVDLAPGESMQYPASFVAARCSAADDEAATFSNNLPPVMPGVYDLSAAIDFTPDASTVPQATGTPVAPGIDLVSGPMSAITLH